MCSMEKALCPAFFTFGVLVGNPEMSDDPVGYRDQIKLKRLGLNQVLVRRPYVTTNNQRQNELKRVENPKGLEGTQWAAELGVSILHEHRHSTRGSNAARNRR